MNNDFIRALRNSGMSMYSLSKKTKLPYTTINRLVNEKMDINNCNSSAVFDISQALGVTMEQILNNYYYLTGTEGEFAGIKYLWSKDNKGHQLLILNDNGTESVAWKGKLLTCTEMAKDYHYLAVAHVKFYLFQQELKAQSSFVKDAV